jgi:type IV pilus assembly protein PilN
MIKINLLPVRAAKKKESARQQLSILLLSIIAIVVIAFGIYSFTLAKILTAQNEISKSEQELKSLKEKIGEINNIKKFQEEVRKKLGILEQLRQNKTGPATRLAKLSDAVPEKVWLTKYTENGVNISLAGVAFNEELIAELMRNLQGSNEFQNVELLVSEQLDIKGVKAKKFDISCSMKSNKVTEPETTKKK